MMECARLTTIKLALVLLLGTLSGGAGHALATEPRLGIEDVVRIRNDVSVLRRAALERFRFAGEKITLGGKEVPLLGDLGEGHNSEVYRLPDSRAIKVPKRFSVSAAASLEAETRVERDLRENFAQYGIHTHSIAEVGPEHTYLIKPLIEPASMAKAILKAQNGQLTQPQSAALERLFHHAVQYARDTGIGLDLKASNLYWDGKDWVLFDTGPRVSYLPYGFTSDLESFSEFLATWTGEEPRPRRSAQVSAVIAQRAKQRAAQIAELKERPIDLVFDVDGVWLLHEDSALNGKQRIKPGSQGYAFGPKRFHLASEFPAVVEELLQDPRVRISVLSAGDKPKILDAVSRVVLPQSGKGLSEIVAFIKARQDGGTTALPDPASDSPLWPFQGEHDRKKDLRQLGTLPNNELDRTLLIDDNAAMAMPGQEKNVLHYSSERDLFFVRDLIKKAIARSDAEGVPLREALWEAQWTTDSSNALRLIPRERAAAGESACEASFMGFGGGPVSWWPEPRRRR